MSYSSCATHTEILYCYRTGKFGQAARILHASTDRELRLAGKSLSHAALKALTGSLCSRLPEYQHLLLRDAESGEYRDGEGTGGGKDGEAGEGSDGEEEAKLLAFLDRVGVVWAAADTAVDTAADTAAVSVMGSGTDSMTDSVVGSAADAAKGEDGEARPRPLSLSSATTVIPAALPAPWGHGHRLSSLVLEHSRIGDAGAAILVDGLLRNPGLTCLNLCYAGLGEEGARAVSRLLRESKSLTTLFMGGNKLGVSGARRIAEGMHAGVFGSNLLSLDLR